MSLIKQEVTPLKLSEKILTLINFCENNKVTLFSLLSQFSKLGHCFFIFFLSLPFATPIPVPGLSTLLGLIIFFSSIAYMKKAEIWLPQKFLSQDIPGNFFAKVFRYIFKFLQIIEKFIRPRMTHLFHIPFMRFVIGGILAINGLLLAAPLPPGTNFPPASVLILVSVADLQKDGLLLLIGFMAHLLNLLFFGALFFYGTQGVQYLYKIFF